MSDFKKLFLSFIFLCTSLYAENYPIIHQINFSDSTFKQFCQEVEENYIILAKRKSPILKLYQYTATEHDDLLSLSARCNISYETIATLNGFAFIDTNIEGKDLYIPTISGIFLPENPSTPLEYLLKTQYSGEEKNIEITVNSNHFYFIPNEKLSSTERLFFTDSSMIAPLAEGIISSSFGIRESPFTGEQQFHKGTDIAAPLGTPVYASKSGIVAVAEIGHTVYGNYVILQHDNNRQSLYAHMDTILVLTGDISEKGQQIGTVGSTGMSTGPHLHFEIKIGQEVKDPSTLIKTFYR